mmetsp:Transcript_6302/g.19490  ORF Transcript_6302/g.19490 Transcript_6302/m.19490 type:complete len:307 (+) Transcript_6302:481-1401(+)
MGVAAATKEARSCFARAALRMASSASRSAVSRTARDACKAAFSCSSLNTCARTSFISRWTLRELRSSSSYWACCLRNCAPMSHSGRACSSAKRRDAASCSRSAMRFWKASAWEAGTSPATPLAAKVPPAAEATASSLPRRDTSASNRRSLASLALRCESSCCLERSDNSSYWRVSISFLLCNCNKASSTSLTRRFLARPSFSSCSRSRVSFARAAASRPARRSHSARCSSASRCVSSNSARKASLLQCRSNMPSRCPAKDSEMPSPPSSAPLAGPAIELTAPVDAASASGLAAWAMSVSFDGSKKL